MGIELTRPHLEQLLDYLDIIEYEGYIYPYTLADKRHKEIVSWIQDTLEDDPLKGLL
jgi:hypothetical protein